MKMQFCLLFLFPLLSSFVNAAEKDAQAATLDVQTGVPNVLTASNFTSFIESKDNVLVMFYAEWCGHCKKLAPNYEQAAAQLVNDKAILAKVDAVAQTELANKYSIRGFPTLKFFKKGQVSDYTGGRSTEQIVQWVRSMIGRAVEVVTEEALKEEIAKHPVSFVARVKSEESEAFEAFAEVADYYRLEAHFFAVISDDAKNEVSAHREDEGPVISLDVDKEKLTNWVDEERFPYFGPVNGENFIAYDTREQNMMWFAGSEEDYKAHQDVVREVAKQFREEYSFVWLNTAQFGEFAKEQLGMSEFPCLGYRLKEGGRYIYPNHKFDSSKDLVQFIKDIAAGKIKKFFNSEPIPETNDEPVKVVVGNNFEEMVFHNDKDVLLEIYAAWCGVCKVVEPIYNEFAQKVADSDVKHLIVAKMDGTLNEPPVANFPYKSFPTIFFVKAGSKEPILFNGQRTVEGFIDFVTKESTKPVKIEMKSKPKEEPSVEKDEL